MLTRTTFSFTGAAKQDIVPLRMTEVRGDLQPMRIAFLYPAYEKNGRRPHLSQNRQVRYTRSNSIHIYPLIPSSLLTIVSKAGHECIILDAINRGLTQEQYDAELRAFRPDVMVLESKTPIMPRLWREVARLKGIFTSSTFVVVGDHVSARPEETLERCPCDYVALGGDYDVIVGKLVEHLDAGAKRPDGAVGRGDECHGSPCFADDLDQIPFVDRDLTRWRDYGEAYLMRPAMYILSGRGCGKRGRAHAGCAFCSWQHNLWKGTARLRSPENFVSEAADLVRRYGVREIFDDNESGGVWDAEWTAETCSRLRKAGLHEKVSLSCNARADCLSEEVCHNLALSGFRLLKVGLESGRDATLKRISKDESVEEVRAGVKRAKDHGLRVLLTMMVGYPWESEEDVQSTFSLAKELLTYKARIGDSLQCSVLVPYPGTPLYAQSLIDGTNVVGAGAYEEYDMDRDVLSSGVDTRRWCGRMWRLYLDPSYVMKVTASVRSFQEFSLGLRGVASLAGHIADYGN